jgi:hypothetical protein
MRAEREKEEAAKFDRFLAQIREMLKDTRLPERRAEVEGMIASAEKIAGARTADIQALRAELARAMEEGARERERAAQLEELLPRIREAIRDVRKLKTRRAEVENWLDQAEKLAGPRRAEVDALRAEAVEAFNKAERYRDLAGHWKLDGDARDSTASGFHGTIKGSPKFVPGKIGSALRFDGDDQELLLPGTPELDRVHEDSYTFTAWFRPEGVPPVSEEDAAHFRYAILVRQGWHLGLSYDHSGHFFMDHWLTGDQNVGLANSKTFPPGDWHHVAGIVDRDAGTTLIHVDGQAAGRRSWTAGKISRNYGKAALRIGCGSPGASKYAWPARGTIDDVRIYGRALSAAEVRKLFEAGKQGRDQ